MRTDPDAQAMQAALDALLPFSAGNWTKELAAQACDAIATLRERLAQSCEKLKEDDKPAHLSKDPWLEAAIAWNVCASIHREYAKGKDALFTTRQQDFINHHEACSAMVDLHG